MSILKNTKKLFVTAAAIGGLSMGFAAPAAAQSAACVNLLVGAGYAAWMGVKFAGGVTWSDSFPIGQHRCINLPVDGMVKGAPYEVVVSAVLGSSKVPCTPAPSAYDPANKNSVTYNAWGTTLNVSCKMPGANADANEVSILPNEDGLQALQKHLTDGAMAAPE